MYITINEILKNYTTLSKPQLDRNYYKLPKEYKEQKLIRLNNGIREVDDSILPELIYRKRKRKYNENDIPALLFNDWNYYGVIPFNGNYSNEYYDAIFSITLNHLTEKHGITDFKVFYIIDREQSQLSYMLMVEEGVNIKRVLKDYIYLIAQTNTNLLVFEDEQREQTKEFIKDEVKRKEVCWGYLES